MVAETVDEVWRKHLEKNSKLIDKIKNDYLKKALQEMEITAFSKLGQFDGVAGGIRVQVKREKKKISVSISYVELGMDMKETFYYQWSEEESRKYYRFFRAFIAECIDSGCEVADRTKKII